MKKTVKSIVLSIVVIFLLQSGSQAQVSPNPVNCAYDASGNRTSRVIVIGGGELQSTGGVDTLNTGRHTQ